MAKKGVKTRKTKRGPPKNNGKHPGGRPVEYTPEVCASIIKKTEMYIKSVEIPSKARLAYNLNIPYQALYEHKEFSDILKRLEMKREAGLEELMLSGQTNVSTGCIFALKQLGWKDKHELEVTEKKYTVIPAESASDNG
jgi:hypothetical protein